MANINDFKNVKQRSKKYSEYLSLSEEQTEINGARFGFYLLVLECVTNVKEVADLQDMIIDTDFRSIVCKERNDDLGVDAVYINSDERIIQLFNFKYRKNFKETKGQELGDMVDVSRFLLPIHNENTEGLSPLSKKNIETIIKELNSDDEWKIELYMVSNENRPLQLDNPTVYHFIETYGMTVHSITLEDIVSYISEFPEDLSAKFVIDSTSVMTYEVDDLSTSKSYLIKLSLAELIRITCSDENIRNNIIEDYSDLQKQKLEMSLLFDNVRGYLGEKTKYNSNIIKTIDNNPNKFFMYNNGLTITTKDIKAGYQNGRKKFACEISGFQIVNGGQTLRSVYEFCNNHFDEEKLANAEILVRLFQTESDRTLTNDIAEFTNSQNAISSIDLKSINNFQIQIESYLKTYEILYVRKSGDVGDRNISYKKRISMEKVAQILYTHMGFPDRSTNQKKALFEKYYDEIFDEDSLDLELVLRLITMYHQIEDEYKNTEFTAYDGKYLYIIYVKNYLPNKSLNECIHLLEKFIVEYKEEEDISAARKLIQKGFKDHVSSQIESLDKIV